MILVFDFEYSQNNDVLEFLLIQILDEFTLEYSIITKENTTSLYVKANEEELTHFAENLASNLPLSVYLLKTSVRVESTMPPSNLSKNQELCFGLTPKMIEIAKEQSSPFVGFDLSVKNLSLTYKEKSYKDEYNELFNKLAQDLKSKKLIKVQVKDKSFIVGDLSLAKDDFLVLPTDFSLLSKIAVLSDDEKKALNSLEKPIIFTKINLVFKSKEILKNDYINIKMADNLFLYFLCKKLFELEVEYIFISSNNIKFDEILEFDEFKFDDKFKVVALNDGQILPLFISDKQKNIEKYNKNKYLHFYLSSKDDDIILLKNDELMKKINIPIHSIKEIFQMIKELDSGGERLLKNYQEQFGELFLNDVKMPNLSLSFYSLLCIAGVVLGMGDFKSAGEKMLLNAEDFSGKKGPRIDCFLTKDGISFDVARFIRSGMSFKLAGVDDMVLSFGYIQSLALFFSDFCDNAKDEFGINEVIISGSIFGYKKLLNEFHQSAKANHKITLRPMEA